MFERVSAASFAAALCACQASVDAPREPTRATPEVEISSPDCTLYAGEDRDPSVLGSPRTDAPRCCEHDFGFDPALAASRCGFREYLGESEELACVHRFVDASGELAQLRLTPIVGLSFAAAIELHERGAGATATHDPPSLWLSSDGERRWALVDGWSTPRRLGWDSRACSDDAIRPVLEAMAATSSPRDEPSPLPRLDLDLEDATLEASAGLLATYAAAPASAPPYRLPEDAAALVDALVIAVAQRDAAAATTLLTPDARWGLPDRRQVSGRPARERDAIAPALTAALRQAAARMPADAQLHCPAIDRRAIPGVRRGEALMWCVWTDARALDLLVFGLRGRIDGDVSDGRVEYVGLFPGRPRAPLRLPGEPPPPPPSPRPAIVCGDPHAVDYPGLCPGLEPSEDDDDDDEDGEGGEVGDAQSSESPASESPESPESP